MNLFSTPKMCSSRFTIIFPQRTVLLTAQVFGKKRSPVDVPFLLPHEIVHALHCAGELQVTVILKKGIGWEVFLTQCFIFNLSHDFNSLQFGRSMTGHRSKASISQFWNHCRTCAAWRDHPCLVKPEVYGSIMADG